MSFLLEMPSLAYQLVCSLNFVYNLKSAWYLKGLIHTKLKILSEFAIYSSLCHSKPGTQKQMFSRMFILFFPP